MTDLDFALDWNAGATAVIDLEVVDDRYRLRFTSPYRSTMRVPSSVLGVTRQDFDYVPREIDDLARAGGFLARGGNGAGHRPSDTLKRLADIGQDLFRLALPPYALNELHGNSLFIELGTDETLHDLPWELLHDGDDFLALKHHLGRFLIQCQTQSGTIAAHELTSDLGTLHALVISVPRPEERDGIRMPFLAAAENEAREVMDALTDAGVKVEVLAGSDACRVPVLRALRKPNHIIHFTGHAVASRQDPRQSSLVLHDENLTVSTLTATLAYQRALFCFINGCETAPSAPQPAAAGSVWDAQFALFGLARAFLESGAYVLGTRWRLPDDSGLGFARNFYKLLLEDGAPIGRAISEARRALLEEDPEDITWASYIYWGDPRVSLRRSLRREPATVSAPALVSAALAPALSAGEATAVAADSHGLGRLADTYENAASSEPSDGNQAVDLTRIVSEATSMSYVPATAEALDELLARGNDGDRVIALAVLEAFPDPSKLDFLLDAVAHPRSPFEQYHALLAIKVLGADVPEAQRDAVAAVLQDQLTGADFLGTDRVVVAQEILAGMGVDQR